LLESSGPPIGISEEPRRDSELRAASREDPEEVGFWLEPTTASPISSLEAPPSSLWARAGEAADSASEAVAATAMS
jgi:hypothetical protein